MQTVKSSRIHTLWVRENREKCVLIAGTGKIAGMYENKLRSEMPGQIIKGFIEFDNEGDCFVGHVNLIIKLREIELFLSNNEVDEIILAAEHLSQKVVKKILSAADYYGIRVKRVFLQQSFDLPGHTYHNSELKPINIIQIPLDKKPAAVFKQSFDLIFSTFTLLFLSPVFILVAIIIKLNSRGPVFYKPIRIGQYGKPFVMYKFRTMLVNDDPLGGQHSTLQNDIRISVVGRFLRKYSIDELPQFLNVLLGNMSIVGPRPHRKFLTIEFQNTVSKYMHRHYVKPGITGWAQVNGWRGPTITSEQKIQRTNHDLWYIQNWTPVLDIKILFLTVFSKKVRKGVY